VILPQVELRGIRKSFGPVAVLEELDLTIGQGEFISLLGPSGCGKTTTLNILAGFLTPDTGDVLLGGQSVTHLPPHRRNLGMVFQRYTLFPHMSVYNNVAFGLRLRKVQEAEIARRVRAMLELVRLPDVGERFPGQLSGGQQQRIALARALVVEPTVLLLDEPLSNLDAKLRREMQIEIRRIHEELGLTTVYVTHDQEESLVLSDRVAVMHEGGIAQLDAPRAIYDQPRTRFVAEFIGETNLLTGRVVEHFEDKLTVQTSAGFRLVVHGDGGPRKPAAGAEVEIVVREERVGLTRQPSGYNSIPVRVARVIFRGAMHRYFLEAGDAELRASVPAGVEHNFEVGATAHASLPPEALVVLESGSRKADTGAA
jgi:putative spermidine/putrescine transport system ATP-binding protein